MHYRRASTPGGSFFFTVVTEGRRPVFAAAENVQVLRTAFKQVRATRPFTIEAIIVLPDHLHCIWTLPPDDADFSTRWRLIKTWFTKHSLPELRHTSNAARVAKHQQAIWQHRYWEHQLRDGADFANHADYIHYNPVKHGLAASPAQWPYSSFQRYVQAGTYPADWGQESMAMKDIGHE
ncbi:transposase [Acidovorax sp. HDW3]|uniref:REP-associated tyrosine transposase n=1 Tax=Acidovorax sp. HDW3 TaxID=2714923 RepID=UPI0014092419|nr:transposase [Acidovorax sp. HDW3]QIL43939.1 transposase [Acidovorax sp. HDW3]